jgi:peptidase M28-like protein
VDALREIEELVAFEGRWPGTDAERRAAAHLADKLRSLGREADVEPMSVWPNYPITHAIHALIAIASSVLSVYSAAAGTALVLFAAISTFGDLTGSFLLVRRLTGRRASQNVFSRERARKPGKLVLVAHYDAARGGAVFSRRALERRAVLGKLIRRPIGPFEPFFWSMMVILVCCSIRLFGVESTALTVVQFVPTVILIASVPLLLDIALSGVVPGASDNASGVATVLRLAEHYGGELRHFDVWVAFPGAEEAFLLGMRELVRKHRRELDAERTVFLNVDIAGNGTVRYMTKEGFVIAYRYHPALIELCDQIAESDEEEMRFGARRMVSRMATDGLAARAAGYPAITITCRNALDYAPNYHQPTDTPDRIELEALDRAYWFCCELIERLDEQVGPDLVRSTEDTELAERGPDRI